MKKSNKIAIIATSAIAVGAMLLASPAIASSSYSAAVTPTATVSPTPVATPTPYAHSGKHSRGHMGKEKGHDKAKAPITKTVTVDVPVTGTYVLLVTEVKAVDATVTSNPRPDHSFTVPVTGTGSQKITLSLRHAGDYKVALVNVVSSQDITATN
jgi:hypothetical protein